MRQPSHAHARAVGAVVAFLVVGLLVKYSDLLFTYEHRWLIQPQGSVSSRLAQFWISLRFSWQEFAIGAGLIGMLLAAHRLWPAPGRVVRGSLIGLRVFLGVASLLSVLAIAYYAVYQTHPTVDDLEHIGWAPQIIGSAGLFSYLSVRICLLVWLVTTVGLPWLAARWAGAHLWRATAWLGVGCAVAAGVTFAAGRPNLAEARLEPNPVVWMLFGRRASYVNLPPVDELASLGTPVRKYEVRERPRNVILVVLESTPAQALYSYNADAPAGRRLVEQFGDAITQFDDVFAISPNSVGTLLSVLTGTSPVPSNTRAAEAAAQRPTLSEIVKTRGFHTQFLLTGPSDAIIDGLIGRGFDRALHMHSDWPGKDRYAPITWGIDDRLLFDDAAAFARAQTPDSPPFLLVLHASNPHHPYSAGMIPGLEDSGDPRTNHRALVHHMMELLTDFYGVLTETGLAETTAVLAYGDHGEAFGEHEGNFIHSKELYWENLHVPVLLLHPRRLGLPARIAQLGTLDDIKPTALDLLGIEAAPGTGMSLLYEAPDRVTFHMTDWGPGQVAFRDAQYTWILSRTGRELLFDRRADPLERHNIVASHPEVAAAFRARLEGR